MTNDRVRIWFNNMYGQTQVYGDGAQVLCYMDADGKTLYFEREADLEVKLMETWQQRDIAVSVAAKSARHAIEMAKAAPGMVVDLTLHAPTEADFVNPHDWQPVYEKSADPFPARYEKCAKCGGIVMYVSDSPFPTGKNPPDLSMDDCPADYP